MRRLQVTAGTEYSDSPDPIAMIKEKISSIHLNMTSNYSEEQTVEYIDHSPLAGYVEWLQEVLHDPEQKQIIWGAFFIVFGFTVTLFGSQVWDYLFPFLVGLFFVGFIFYQEEALNLVAGEGIAARIAVVLQVGITMALATWNGLEGSQLLLGAGLGFLAAQGSSGCLISLEPKFPGVATSWCCIISFLGSLLFIHEGQYFYLAVLTPMFGSYAAAAGLGSLAAYIGLDNIVSKDALFTDVAQELLGNSGPSALAWLGFFGAAAGLRHRLASFSTDSERSKVDQQAAVIGSVAIFGLMLANTTGFGCRVVDRCPAWLEPVEKKMWPLCGGLIWALLNFLGSMAQLSNTQDVGGFSWSSPRMGDLEKMGRRNRRNTVASSRRRGNSRSEEVGLLG